GGGGGGPRGVFGGAGGRAPRDRPRPRGRRDRAPGRACERRMAARRSGGERGSSDGGDRVLRARASRRGAGGRRAVRELCRLPSRGRAVGLLRRHGTGMARPGLGGGRRGGGPAAPSPRALGGGPPGVPPRPQGAAPSAPSP